MFAIQDEIAESVATSLRGSVLSRREKQALRAAADRRGGLRVLPARPAAPSPHDAAGPGDEAARCSSARLSSMPATVRPGPAWRRCTPRCTSGLARKKTTWSGQNAPASGRWSSAPDLAEAHVARGCVLSLSAALRRSRARIRRGHPPQSRICSMPTTTSPEPASRAVTSRARPSSFGKAADVRQEDFQSPMLLGAVAAHARPRRRGAGGGAARASAAPSTCSC